MSNPLASHFDHLRADFDSVLFETFVDACTVQQDVDRYLIITPNRATEKWLRQNFAKPLAARLQDAQDPRKIEFAINPTAAAPTPPPTPRPLVPQPAKAKAQKTTGLITTNNFAAFVPGDANETALMVARKIAEGGDSAKALTPFFLYGSTGVGKTHLAHAIGNEYLCNYPQRRVLFTTARGYMKNVVDAVRNKQVDAFKHRYQSLDLLIIDDIHSIGGDSIVRTQNELLELLNHFADHGKPLIFTCDRPPGKVELPPRLSSRVNKGITMVISPPGFGLRMSILAHKAKAERNMTLADDVVQFIASHVKSDVRALEGALLRVFVYAGFRNTAPTVAICREALPDLIQKSNAPIHPDLIKEKVARHYHVRIADLSSKRKSQTIAQARHCACYLCRQMTTLSLPDIARHFNRVHTSVMHSCKVIEKQLTHDSSFQGELKLLEMSIRDTLN